MGKSSRRDIHMPCKPHKRPKIRGCYECSRRRIDCDRGQPQCQKCTNKGLQCSGLGIRYRFSDDPASTGKLIARQGLTVTGNETIATETLENPDSVADCRHTLFQSESLLPMTVDYVGKHYSSSADGQSLANEYPICQTPDHLKGRTRSLLLYFSQHIAPMMAVIDKGWNGYRDLLLPIAEEDELVQKAVLAASTHHLALRTGGFMLASPRLHHNVLSGLKARSMSGIRPVSQDEGSLLTILLLLLCEMITGGEDFRLLYGVLKTFVRMCGDETQPAISELGNFLKIQVHKFQLYAEALLDDTDGSNFVSAQAENCLEYLRFCRNMHPEHEDFVLRLESLISQACHIYVHRAVNNVPVSHTIHLVEDFKQTAESILHESFGQNVLGWSYFVVAAESSTPEHRLFFVDRIEHLYRLTGFANNLKGLAQLRKIWETQDGVRWTSLLGGPAQVLIM